MSESKPLQFVDTNVLIYAHDHSMQGKRPEALALINHLWATRTGCLSIQVLQEFSVNMTRKIAHPVTPEVAAQLIADLSAWRVHRPSVDDLLAAIRIQQRYQLAFWDAMIINSAVQLGCRTLWSEDLNPGQTYDGIRVQSPF